MGKALGCTAERFGIMNHVGSIWTPETFDTEPEAQKYLDEQRKIWAMKTWGSLDKHRVVRVNVRVTPAKDRS